MGAFDGLIAELAGKFNLEDRAAPLCSGLLGVMTDSSSGGLTGFVDRMRRGGLGQQVNSWIGTGPNESVAPEQIEQALGRDTVERIASTAGVSPGTGRSALAFLIPKAVDILTPGGTIPAGMPAGIGSYLAGAAGLAGGAGVGAREAVRGAGAGIGAAAASGSSGLRKLVPVMLVLLFAFLGYRMLGKRTPGSAGIRSEPTAMAPAEPAGGAYDSTAEPTTPPAAPSAAAAVEGATKKASSALSGLRPGYTGGQLVEALNLSIINFAPGKADLPAESRDILDQSAKAIKGAPAGTVLEVGGHADNTGDATANQALSARRAEAVRDYLVRQGVEPGSLTAKGYGSSKPVADNSTEDGRFKNRRIEFTVAK